MNTERHADTPANPEPSSPADGTPVTGADGGAPDRSRMVIWLSVALAVLALLLGGLLWQRLASMQEQLARQSADSGANAVEARAVARQAQEQARDAAARLALLDARLSEVALQRGQLEELMQSLSRSRDENLVVDIESAIRLAQQQAQLTGSAEPLLATLKTADQRLTRAAQPRLTPLQRAIARDAERIKATALSDMPTLLARLDELVRQVDELPLANAVASVAVTGSLKPQQGDSVASWWQRSLQVVGEEVRALVRVSRIEQPEAALLSPEQSFFLRENFKLKLLNARLGLLSRQFESVRADLAAAAVSLTKYFDASSRKTQAASGLLQQIQKQSQSLELPRVDDTLSALATAAAGR